MQSHYEKNVLNKYAAKVLQNNDHHSIFEITLNEYLKLSLLSK